MAAAAATSVSSHAWWLASRASGLVALTFMTLSAAMALAVAARIVRRPAVAALHRQTAVIVLVAIAVHGIALLGDPWLNVGPPQVAIPFGMPYRPFWTGIGVLSGYLTAILGLSFYVRRHIGPRLWRVIHRLMPIAYALAIAHVLGSGTDATTVWLRAWLALSVAVLAALFLWRVGYAARRSRVPRAAAGPTR